VRYVHGCGDVCARHVHGDAILRAHAHDGDHVCDYGHDRVDDHVHGYVCDRGYVNGFFYFLNLVSYSNPFA